MKASEANELTLTYSKLQLIYSSIKEQALKGSKSIYVQSFDMNKYIKEELEKNGYLVEASISNEDSRTEYYVRW